MKFSLQHPYPGVGREGAHSYGGNQRWLRDKAMQHCGCGVVAALDLVRYLHLYRDGFATDFFVGVEDRSAVSRPLYDLCAQRMRNNYVPVIYPIGTTGFGLASGLNKYFRRYDLPLQASWGLSAKNLWQEMETMLDNDLPVILSVGNRFPRVWSKETVILYRRSADGTMQEGAKIHAHFFTVTGMDAQWLRVSSWGNEYYIKKEEFFRYCHHDSIPLLCNMVLLRQRRTD